MQANAFLGTKAKYPNTTTPENMLCFQYYCYYHNIIIITNYRNENTAFLQIFFERLREKNPTKPKSSHSEEPGTKVPKQTQDSEQLAGQRCGCSVLHTEELVFCLLLTSSYTAINIFIFGSCHQEPVSPCLFPCTLRPSNTPASCNAQTLPEGAWFWLTACADLDVYCDWKIAPLSVPPSLASFPPVPLHHPRSTDR